MTITSPRPSVPAAPSAARLRPSDLAALASIGLRDPQAARRAVRARDRDRRRARSSPSWAWPPPPRPGC